MIGATDLIARGRQHVQRLAGAGDGIAVFAERLSEQLRRMIPHTAACVVTLDPATGLLTGTYKFGALAGRHELDATWAQLEYATDDPTRMLVLAGHQNPAFATSQLSGGVHASIRMRELILPGGFGDELRMVARHAGRPWGGVNLFRALDQAPFSPQEVTALATLSELVADGLRAALMVRSAETTGGAPPGTAVMVLDETSTIQRVSVGMEELLEELTDSVNRSPAMSIIQGLVTTARGFSSGAWASLPRTRFRLASGRWLVAQAAPLAGGRGPLGEVVVTIADASPPEIVPLIAAALGLTHREREVTQLVLAGADTKGIARQLAVSAYTVQDHLKSIFEKAGVRSRGELVARVFFDQYAPRLDDEVGPGGWFHPADPVAADP